MKWKSQIKSGTERGMVRTYRAQEEQQNLEIGHDKQ